MNSLFDILYFLFYVIYQASTAQDVDALIALYQSANGRQWKNSWNLTESDKHCNWYGVTCDPDKRVVMVYLQDNKMQGSIPTQFYQTLNKLEGLWLSNVDEITYQETQSPYRNKIDKLNLEVEFLVSLKWLEINDVGLTGQIPNSITKLKNLEVLNLGNNVLSGPIPFEIAQMKSLRVLELYNNNLTGQIPPRIVDCPLEIINIYQNKFEGDLPRLDSLATLIVLDIRTNNLTRFPVSILLQEEIRALPQFQYIAYLGNNMTSNDNVCDGITFCFKFSLPGAKLL